MDCGLNLTVYNMEIQDKKKQKKSVDNLRAVAMTGKTWTSLH